MKKNNVTIVKTGLKDKKIKTVNSLEILSFYVTIFANKTYWEKIVRECYQKLYDDKSEDLVEINSYQNWKKPQIFQIILKLLKKLKQ